MDPRSVGMVVAIAILALPGAHAFGLGAGKYRIESKHGGGQFMTQVGSSYASGANVVREKAKGWNTQTWRIHPAPGAPGFYKIEVEHGGNRFLTQAGGGYRSGANVVVAKWKGWNTQLWKLHPAGGGFYRIEIRHGGNRFLTAVGGGYESGANVVVEKWKGWNTQLWRLHPQTQPLRGGEARGSRPPPAATPRASATHCFRASNGTFLQVTPSHQPRVMGRACGPWEKFAVQGDLRVGGKVALRGNFGRYLSAQPNGTLEGNRTAAGGWEQFVITAAGKPAGAAIEAGDKVALRSFHGKWVQAVGGGGGAAKAAGGAARQWETFVLMGVGGPPAERARSAAASAGEPPPDAALILKNPEEAFRRIYLNRPAIAGPLAPLRGRVQEARSRLNEAVQKLKSLVSFSGGLGVWKSKRACAPVKLKVKGSCKAYAQKCGKWGLPKCSGPPWKPVCTSPCQRWDRTNTCLVWWPDSVRTEDRCGDVRYFDPSEGKLWGQVKSKAEAAWRSAKSAFDAKLRTARDEATRAYRATRAAVDRSLAKLGKVFSAGGLAQLASAITAMIGRLGPQIRKGLKMAVDKAKGIANQIGLPAVIAKAKGVFRSVTAKITRARSVLGAVLKQADGRRKLLRLFTKVALGEIDDEVTSIARGIAAEVAGRKFSRARGRRGGVAHCTSDKVWPQSVTLTLGVQGAFVAGAGAGLGAAGEVRFGIVVDTPNHKGPYFARGYLHVAAGVGGGLSSGGPGLAGNIMLAVGPTTATDASGFFVGFVAEGGQRVPGPLGTGFGIEVEWSLNEDGAAATFAWPDGEARVPGFGFAAGMGKQTQPGVSAALFFNGGLACTFDAKEFDCGPTANKAFE